MCVWWWWGWGATTDHTGINSQSFKPVHNWANICFASILRSICRTVFGVQKALLDMIWENSPSSTNLVSDRLRAESSPVDEVEIKIKMEDGVARYFTRFGGIFFIC